MGIEFTGPEAQPANDRETTSFMLKLSSMADPEVTDRLTPLTFLDDFDSKKIDVTQEIKDRMERGLSYENAVREIIDEIKNKSDFTKSFFTKENIEILVKQAIEDKEWLLR